MKKLFLISQRKKTGYDTYDSVVVCAENEEEARLINPGGFYKWHDGAWYFQYADGTEEKKSDDTWGNPSDVFVQEIGTADQSLEIGAVICASYNAG